MGDRVTSDNPTKNLPGWNLDLAGIASLREWLAQWGPEGSATWNDATGMTVPIQKSTLVELLHLAENHLLMRDAIRAEAADNRE